MHMMVHAHMLCVFAASKVAPLHVKNNAGHTPLVCHDRCPTDSFAYVHLAIPEAESNKSPGIANASSYIDQDAAQTSG